MKRVLLATLTAAMILAISAACEPPPRAIEPGRGPVSSAIAVDHDKILVAAEDHGQLLILDRVSKQLQSRVDVGDAPGHVIVTSDGNAAVTTRFGGTVVLVDVQKGRVTKSIDVGVEPVGLVEINPGTLAVVLAGESSLAIVDTKAGTVTSKIALKDKDPRAVALLADGTLYISHMATGTFSHVDLKTGTAKLVDVTTQNQFGPTLTAEHLRTLTLDPVSGHVLVAHTQANTQTVRAPIGDPTTEPLPGGGGENCGYSGCQEDLPAATPGITEVDPVTGVVVTPQAASQVQNPTNGGSVPVDATGGASDCFDCGGGGSTFVPNPPSVLNPHEARLNGTHIQNPAALALFDGGRGQLMVNLGSKNAVLLNRNLNGTANDVIATVKLGNGAQSVAISDDGKFAYVWNQFDVSLSEIELPQVGDNGANASKFVPDASGKPVAAPELSVVPELQAKTIKLPVADALTPEASLGRKLFHDATDARISSNDAVSCATCHPDGRHDGRTWQFVFGPRNTPQLGGSILDTAPFHWPGDVASVPDLNRMTVLPFMGGTGLDEGNFQYIAAYIGQLRAAPSPATVRTLTTQEARGKALFESDTTTCTSCHAGAHFTDNLNHNIGTAALNAPGGSDITDFQTPVLHGLNRSAPYLHDGSQATLEDLVKNVIKTNKMGHGSDLTDQDASDLVAYLKTL